MIISKLETPPTLRRVLPLCSILWLAATVRVPPVAALPLPMIFPNNNLLLSASSIVTLPKVLPEVALTLTTSELKSLFVLFKSTTPVPLLSILKLTV